MASPAEPEFIPLQGGELSFWSSFLSPEQADALYRAFYRDIPWEQSRIRIAGREILIPRLNAWFGDPGAHYSYSGTTLIPRPWTPSLLGLRRSVEEITGLRFNSALLNCYRDGADSVDWHSDNEPELGRAPAVASVSLGAVRRFELRRRDQRRQKFQLYLPHGSLLLMAGELQHYWQHRMPRDRTLADGRINITFRTVIDKDGSS